MKRKFMIIAQLSGNVEELEGNETENGAYKLTYNGNKRSSESSIMRQFKRDLSFWGIKLEKVIEFKEI